MKKFEALKKELLTNSEVADEYNARKIEFAIARALIKARLEAKLTQEEVADKMQTSQSQIARMESGHHIPSMLSIYKYAKATNSPINLSINP